MMSMEYMGIMHEDQLGAIDSTIEGYYSPFWISLDVWVNNPWFEMPHMDIVMELPKSWIAV